MFVQFSLVTVLMLQSSSGGYRECNGVIYDSRLNQVRFSQVKNAFCKMKITEYNQEISSEDLYLKLG